MLHLSSERLAELADGEPTIAEAEHLAACAICATERSAHRRLLTLASDERARETTPLTSWETLSVRLRAEGLIGDVPALAAPVADGVVPFVPARRHRRAWLAGLRIAAGLVIAATFGALGRISAGADAVPSGPQVLATVQRIVGVGDPEIMPSIVPGSDDSFASIDDALASLSQSQRDYDRAVAYIAAHDSTVESPDADRVYRTRLAALDEMAEASLQALAAAPADPVINQYYLSTLGAREVTLRQLGSVLTPRKRLSRF